MSYIEKLEIKAKNFIFNLKPNIHLLRKENKEDSDKDESSEEKEYQESDIQEVSLKSNSNNYEESNKSLIPKKRRKTKNEESSIDEDVNNSDSERNKQKKKKFVKNKYGMDYVSNFFMFKSTQYKNVMELKSIVKEYKNFQQIIITRKKYRSERKYYIYLLFHEKISIIFLIQNMHLIPKNFSPLKGIDYLKTKGVLIDSEPKIQSLQSFRITLQKYLKEKTNSAAQKNKQNIQKSKLNEMKSFYSSSILDYSIKSEEESQQKYIKKKRSLDNKESSDGGYQKEGSSDGKSQKVQDIRTNSINREEKEKEKENDNEKESKSSNKNNKNNSKKGRPISDGELCKNKKCSILKQEKNDNPSGKK